MKSPALATTLFRIMPLVVAGIVVGLISPSTAITTFVISLPIAIGLGLRHPAWVLALFVFAGAFKTIVLLPFDLTVALATALVVLCMRVVGREGLPELDWRHGAFAAVMLLVAAGVVYGGFNEYGVEKGLRFVVLGGIAFFGTVVLIRRERAVFEFAQGVLCLGAVLSVVAVITGGNPDVYGRLTTLGANTISLGRTASMALLVSVTSILWRRRAAWWAIPVASLSLWAMVGSGARGPALAAVLALSGVVLYRLAQAGANRAALTAGGIAVGALGYATWEQLPAAAIRRFEIVFSAAPGTSVDARLDSFALAMQQIIAHPVTGIGTGRFSAVSARLDYPHNMLLELAAENGVIVAGIMLAVLFASIIAAYRKILHEPGFVTDFVLGGLVLSIVNAMVSGDLNDNRLLYVFLALAFLELGQKSAETPQGVSA